MIQFDFGPDGEFRARMNPKAEKGPKNQKKPVDDPEKVDDEPLPDVTPEGPSEHEKR